MDAALQPVVVSETTILDLNDDCLRKVFNSFGRRSLIAAVDVSSRFRQIAMLTARAKFKNLELHEDSPNCEYSMLRKFGAIIGSVRVNGRCTRKSQKMYQKRVMRLLAQHCVGERIELMLMNYDINDQIFRILLPLIGRVQKLKYIGCRFGTAFLSLPTPSPELRELDYEWCNNTNVKDNQFGAFDWSFQQLNSIRLKQIANVNRIDIEAFMRRNPQLKKIEVLFCPKLGDSIFQTIAIYVPEIEELNFASANMVNVENLEYVGRLRKLKSLTISLPGYRYYIQLMVHEIASANIGLEFLDLTGLNVRYTQQFIEGISKLKKLKSLRLTRVGNLTASHVVEMCKPLDELLEIKMSVDDFNMTIDDILTFIGNAGQLRMFDIAGCTWSGQTILDADTIKKIINIANQRREKTPLTLRLDKRTFIADIPAELIAAGSSSLILQIC